VERRVYDCQGHAHFVTFSCYKRRRFLDDNRAKGIVLHFLAEELKKSNGSCIGYVIMPDQVHALIYFKEPGMISRFIQQISTQNVRMLNRARQGCNLGVARILAIRARSARGY
jgi:putative transposase